MVSGDLVKLEVSTYGPDRRNVRLTYMDPNRTNTTNRAASFQHTHYSYIKQANRNEDVASDKNSIVFKRCGVSHVNFVDGEQYFIEFKDQTRALEFMDALSLPGIQMDERAGDTHVVQFNNTFDRKTWNAAVSSIEPAAISNNYRSLPPPRSEQKARKKEMDRKKKKRKQKKQKKKTSHRNSSGLFCFW